MSTVKISKTVGNEWVWFDEYYFLKGDYFFTLPGNRTVEVRTGISQDGHSTGTRQKITGAGKVSFNGIGALFIRVADGQGPVDVMVEIANVRTGIGISFPFSMLDHLPKEKIDELENLNKSLATKP